MVNAQKHNICVNVPSSKIFRSENKIIQNTGGYFWEPLQKRYNLLLRLGNQLFYNNSLLKILYSKYYQ
jgi:hypothetical protein